MMSITVECGLWIVCFNTAAGKRKESDSTDSIAEPSLLLFLSLLSLASHLALGDASSNVLSQPFLNILPRK
jgi:hypothetical protein